MLNDNESVSHLSLLLWLTNRLVLTQETFVSQIAYRSSHHADRQTVRPSKNEKKIGKKDRRHILWISFSAHVDKNIEPIKGFNPTWK